MATKEEKAKIKATALSQIPFGFDGGQELQDILDKGWASSDEMALLRDRRSYLTKEQLEHFGIKGKGAEVVEEEGEKTPEKDEGAGDGEPVKEETAKEKKAREKTEKKAAQDAEKAAKKAEKDAKKKGK